MVRWRRTATLSYAVVQITACLRFTTHKRCRDFDHVSSVNKV